MQDLNLAALLREALALSGCSEQQIGQFDAHSPIELVFDDLPSLHMAMLDDDVWCWSSLGEFNARTQEHFAAALFEFQLEGWAFARTGQLQFLHDDSELQLRVLLSREALSGARPLAEAIDSYIERLLALRELLR